MTKQAIFYLIFFVLFHFPIFINSAQDFDPLDYELYGPTLAANDQFIIAIQNRTGVSFSAVSSYTSSSPNFCSLTYTPSSGLQVYVTMIALGRNGLASTNINKFVFITYTSNDTTTYLVVGSINFSPCQLSILSESMIFNTTYPEYSVLGVDSNGLIAFYLSNTNIYMQNLISPYHASNWSTSRFSGVIPLSVDLQDTWGILGCYVLSSSQGGSSNFIPSAYLINFANCIGSTNSSCFTPLKLYKITYTANWQSFEAPPADVVSDTYNSLYDISVSTNGQGYALLGVQSINTVYLLSVSSSSIQLSGSRLPSTIASIGFGKSVGWLDNTTAAILLNNFTIDYVQWRSSNIELYPITSPKSLSNSISAYASYPNSHQQLWSQLNPRLINMVAVPTTDSLIYMDYVGNVHVILPSPAGYFAYTSNGIGKVDNTIYIAPTLPCSSGTIKNQSAYGQDLFRYCLLCPEGTFYYANNSNQTNQCSPCNSTIDFCPLGAVTQLPLSVLDTISQAQVYPQSPENDVFEDILLLNMFNVNFPTDCLSKQPFFFALIIMGIGFLVLLFMGLLKLTGKCKKQRRMIKSIFKQTDLIGEGELWIGGVASFAIVVISVFAYRFSSAFINQYPIEDVGNATFACDPTLRNAKFSTNMQSLGVPVLAEEQPLFDMLDNQSFTLNVAFINTDFTANNLAVSQQLGSILLNLPQQTNVTNGILSVSTNLTSHSTTIIFNVSDSSAVGAIRVGLTGPSMKNNNYYVRELNFSNVFNYTNRTVTQDPMITVQLIKLINETTPLSDNDDSQYSALWIPTFIVNSDQLFYSETDFRLYHVLDNTVLTVEITEATYYIYNREEPITKLTEVIFTDILFTTMCIELFGLTFLFFKLAILPILKRLFGFCFGTEKITPKGNQNGCPYCRSVDPETLPAYRVPVLRADQDAPMYPIRRQTSDIANIHIISTPPAVFD